MSDQAFLHHGRRRRRNRFLAAFVAAALPLAGCIEGIDEADPDDPPEFRDAPTGVPTESEIEVRMDSLVYSTGKFVNVEVVLGSHAPFGNTLDMVMTSALGNDVEAIKLTFDGQKYVKKSAVKVQRTSAAGTPMNGVLNVPAGEMFHAMFFVDKSNPIYAGIEPKLIYDWAFMDGNIQGAPAHQVIPQLAMTDDENKQGHKRAGTLLVDNGMPVQVATHELIFYPRDQAQLSRFLQVTGGAILDQTQLSTDGADADNDGEADIGMGLAVLVSVNPLKINANWLPLMRRLFEETELLMGSNSEVLGIYNTALALQAEGFKVGVNPRLQFMAGPPRRNDPIAGTHTMWNRNNSVFCTPNDPADPCVENMPSLWAHQSLMDADDARVNVAVLDMGFATNADFRAPVGAPMHECDMTPLFGPPVCGPGQAQGSPTVNNSFFGGRSWHGTGVVSTAGGIVDNAAHHVGVAGQTMVPMLYKYDLRAYAFEIGEGLIKATDDGASVINVSAGYPCNILTTVGPDFNICTSAGRAGLCAIVTAAAHAAAGVTCGLAAAIPFAGPFICAAAVGGAATATAACISTLALGDVSGPMAEGVRHAQRNGVPITAVAGNVLADDDLPPVIRDFVANDNHVTEDWGVIPAVIEPVIAVGSVGSDLINSNYFGDAVDIWAPIPTEFSAPSNVDDITSPLVTATIGGTSAAAPYIAGVIASMQAMDPSLDPQNPLLTDPERRGVVATIRGILLAEENTWNDAELVSLGFATDTRRRVLVDPLGTLESVAASVSFDVRTRGYDTSLGLGFFEEMIADDWPWVANDLALGAEVSGTIIDIQNTDAPATMPADEDYYEITMPGIGWQRAIIVVTYPLDPGADRVFIGLPDGSPATVTHLSTGGDAGDTVRTYAIDGAGGSKIQFWVSSLPGEDNLYRVRYEDAGAYEMDVDILEPSVPDGDTLCAGSDIRLRAYVDVPPDGNPVPDDQVEWTANGEAVGEGRETSVQLDPGTYDITVSAGDAEDSVTITVVDCEGGAPVVAITTPGVDLRGDDGVAYTGYDEETGLWYADVPMKGVAVDPEDGVLGGASMVWTLVMEDGMDGDVLGHGIAPTVRLYSDDCAGTQHTIRLTASDSEMPTPNKGYAIRIINIWVAC